MPRRSNGRRTYGTGSIFVQAGAFYGQWRVDGRQVKRKLGATREPGGDTGLTRKQAERRLRELMAESLPPRRTDALSFEAAATQYLSHLEEVMERKRTTIQDYRIILRRHLAPYFGRKAIDTIAPHDIGDYI